jgi:hypothetical protein
METLSAKRETAWASTIALARYAASPDGRL